MANGRHGLGIGPTLGSFTAPSPRIIDQFFKHQLRYTEGHLDNPNPFYIKYTKNLNTSNAPTLPDLENISIVSYMVVDLYTGSIIDQYLKINKGKPIRSYDECPKIKSIELMFQWHVNLVHMSREYIKCGWLERKATKRELETAKTKCFILNRVGVTDIFNKARPAELVKPEELKEHDSDN